MTAILLQLAALFSVLSLLAVGGGNAVLPEMQRQAVDVHHWMTNREFLDVFAISRAAPGPGTLVVILVGLKAAGFWGAAVAFVAMFTPSGLMVHLAARVWHRARHTGWYELLEQALAPVAIGLTFAGGLSLARGMTHEILPLAITVLATLLLAFTETHPLLVMTAGAILLVAGG